MSLGLNRLRNWGSAEIVGISGRVLKVKTEADRLGEINLSVSPRVLPYNIWHSLVFSLVDLVQESRPRVRFIYFLPLHPFSWFTCGTVNVAQ